eukprot:scaffold681041_cov76-Prasinocladus_malaysianus.AAC.1
MLTAFSTASSYSSTLHLLCLPPACHASLRLFFSEVMALFTRMIINTSGGWCKIVTYTLQRTGLRCRKFWSATVADAMLQA